MTTPKETWDLAGALLEGEPVDWSRFEQEGSTRPRPLIASLQSLAGLAAAGSSRHPQYGTSAPPPNSYLPALTVAAIAAVHILIFGLLITLADTTGAGLFSLLAFGFYWYMPFEAYYSAKKRKLSREGIELESPIDRLHRQLGIDTDKQLYGGVALIVDVASLIRSSRQLADESAIYS